MARIRRHCGGLDAAGLTVVIAKLRLRATADVIIFDRYIYDQVANLNLTNRKVRAVVRVLLRFTARPIVPCLFDADPVSARSRKPEYPLDFLRRNRQSYLTLAEMAGMEVIPAGSTEEVAGNVRRAVICKLTRAHGHAVDLLPVSKI